MTNREYRVLEVDEMGIDDEEVCDFIERHWKRRVAISLPGFHDWQFRQSPGNGGKNRCLVVVDGRDCVRGFMGVNAREVQLRGHARSGAELTTWVIAEELRGTGLGKAIVQSLQQSYDVILGMGISEAALALYVRFGFKYIRYLPRYVRVFDPDAIEPISELTPLGRRRIRVERPVEQVSHRSSRIEAPEAADFAKSLHEVFNCGSRDARHLEWRYSRHPVYAYEAFRISHGSDSAAVILRVDEKDSLRIVHVVDFLGDAESVPAAISFLEGFCRDREAHMSDFYCSQAGIGHLFWNRGWFSAVDDFYVQVPNWFHPIDMRTPPTTSIILWAKNDMDSLVDQSRLYVTKGDCDLDRPTIQYLEEHRFS